MGFNIHEQNKKMCQYFLHALNNLKQLLMGLYMEVSKKVTENNSLLCHVVAYCNINCYRPGSIIVLYVITFNDPTISSTQLSESIESSIEQNDGGLGVFRVDVTSISISPGKISIPLLLVCSTWLLFVYHFYGNESIIDQLNFIFISNCFFSVGICARSTD